MSILNKVGFEITRHLVRNLLERPLNITDPTRSSTERWTLQGMGMLRAYLSEEIRLHIWDSRFRVKDVSDIHDHPWGFESHVVAGRMTNTRYSALPCSEDKGHTVRIPTHLMGRIVCGPSPKVKGAQETSSVYLATLGIESYEAGSVYSQSAPELHSSAYEDGTVTIVKRTFTQRDREHAMVCWPIGTKWVSAEPRPATFTEVMAITTRALQNLPARFEDPSKPLG